MLACVSVGSDFTGDDGVFDAFVLNVADVGETPGMAPVDERDETGELLAFAEELAGFLAGVNETAAVALLPFCTPLGGSMLRRGFIASRPEARPSDVECRVCMRSSVTTTSLSPMPFFGVEVAAGAPESASFSSAAVRLCGCGERYGIMFADLVDLTDFDERDRVRPSSSLPFVACGGAVGFRLGESLLPSESLSRSLSFELCFEDVDVRDGDFFEGLDGGDASVLYGEPGIGARG